MCMSVWHALRSLSREQCERVWVVRDNCVDTLEDIDLAETFLRLVREVTRPWWPIDHP